MTKKELNEAMAGFPDNTRVGVGLFADDVQMVALKNYRINGRPAVPVIIIAADADDEMEVPV